MARALALAALALLSAPARAEDPLLEGGRHTVSGGIITNPVGLYSRYDLSFSTGTLARAFGDGPWGELELGLYTQYLFFSNELGVQLAWQTDPALVRLSLDAALEPGAFIHAPAGVDDPRVLKTLPRRFGTRRVVRAVNTVNLKLESFWLYSRSTALVRLRDFREFDPFNGVVLDDEVAFEQATALFLPVATLPAARRRAELTPRLWLYGEYTVGVILGVDARPNRVSAGLVSEHWPLPQLLLNLDLFYSFANAPIDGLGAIFVWGFAW